MLRLKKQLNNGKSSKFKVQSLKLCALLFAFLLLGCQPQAKDENPQISYENTGIYPPILGEPDFDSITGDTIYHTIPDFSFVNQENQIVNSISFHGKIYVADFFFTTCPSICPLMTKQLTRVQKEFEGDTTLKIISFTVDPDKDKSEVLKSYAEKNGANPQQWSFCTGEKQKIYRLGQKGFLLVEPEYRNDTIDFLHSDKLVLIDQHSRIRGFYSGTDSNEVNQLIKDIKILKNAAK
ncbi:MAG: SCO family protein [Bacteroidetes bacterium]|nr:SCO family protein [Bacteroidota bacterium]